MNNATAISAWRSAQAFVTLGTCRAWVVVCAVARAAFDGAYLCTHTATAITVVAARLAKRNFAWNAGFSIHRMISGIAFDEATGGLTINQQAAHLTI